MTGRLSVLLDDGYHTVLYRVLYMAMSIVGVFT